MFVMKQLLLTLVVGGLVTKSYSTPETAWTVAC